MRRLATLVCATLLSAPIWAMHCPQDMAKIDALLQSDPPADPDVLARVKELRDAHLTQTKIEASTVSERMTFLMVIPSLIFGLLFLIPPLLRLLSE